MSQNLNQPKQEDSFITFFWVIGMFAVITIVIWLRFHAELTMATIYIRGFFTSPLWVLNVIFAKMFGFPMPVVYQLVQTTAELCNPAGSFKFWSCTRDPSTVAWKEIQFASFWWNGVYTLIALFLLIKAFLKIQDEHPGGKFNKPHTLESFIKEQTQNYPHLEVFGELNMLERDNMKGWYRGMDSVREFAFKHGLVKGIQHRKIDYVVEGATHQHTDETEIIPVLDKQKLTQIMRDQLGELWIDVDHLTDAETVILALYIGRAASTQESMSDEEFKSIENECIEIQNTYWKIAAMDVKSKYEFQYDENDPDTFLNENPRAFSSFPINDLKNHIREYMDYEVIKKLLSKHAYVRTFIIDVIYEARKLGVMAPTEIRWLKLYDRTMWAMVQNIGRPSLFSENLGANAHFVAENIMERAMHEPIFTVALRGYEKQLQFYSYNEQFSHLKVNGSWRDVVINEVGDVIDQSPFSSGLFETLETNELGEKEKSFYTSVNE
ncbi:TPA: hypothetical protein ACGIK9_003444 [Acinetobacter baumannii]|uniref:secretion/conjugation apparatus DotM-related subunit n=1 Tax=Acinetobacter baumannii TaxID=470 RepID=UPI00338DACE8